MNPIYETIVKARDGHYCHALELTYTYELECIIDSIIEEFEDGQFSDDATIYDVVSFFQTIQIYFIEDEELTSDENSVLENTLHAFNFKNYILG